MLAIRIYPTRVILVSTLLHQTLPMDHVLFDNIAGQLPLTDPKWFTTVTDYGYDPGTQARNPEVNPVTEYWVSFLTNVEQFNLVKDKLLAQYNQYRTNGTITRLPLTVYQEQYNNIYDGAYDVFWVLEQNWFERMGPDNFRVNLHGYGEPVATTGTILPNPILPNQVFTIAESASVGAVIGTVEGFNPGVNIEPNPTLPFSYDPSTGTLAVSNTLDYESESEYSISIGNTPITIYVLDEAESPVYERTEYIFYTQSSTRPGDVIGTVNATIIGDSGLKPSYSIVSGNDNGSFSIDPYTGDIVVLNMGGILDNHIIGVSDNHGTTVTCTLRVLDDPIFTTHRFTIAATVTNGAIVGQIIETGYTLRYTDGIFELQGDNLVVVNNQELNPGTYEIDIDTGSATPVKCFIYVPDVSSGVPGISGAIEYWVSSEASNGTSLGTPELNYDSYSITPSTIFGINSATGEIYVIASSLLTPSTYTVNVNNSDETLTTPITIVAYAVATEADFEFTVASNAPVGTLLGNIGGASPYTLSSGGYGTLSLGVTGDITVASNPVSATQFTVSDDQGSDITVAISLSDGDTSEEGFTGILLSGQEGQSVATHTDVLYSVGPVGFGQGTLQVAPDNTTPPKRTMAGSVVVSIPTTLSYTFGVSAEATQAMLDALLPLYANQTSIKVSVTGTDWDATIVEINFSYSDTISVNLTCMSVVQ